MDEIKDDGSLNLLAIPREENGFFNCPTTNQQNAIKNKEESN